LHSKLIRRAVELVPAVLPLLSAKARWIIAIKSRTDFAVKTYDYYLSSLEVIVQGTYNGKYGTNSFADAMAALVASQLEDAYSTAWYDSDLGGGDDPAFPDYLQTSLDAMIETYASMDFIYQFYNDIIQARIEETGDAEALSRAVMWAARWNEAYNEAIRLITLEAGGKMMWIEGDTEKKCDVCVALDGLVAYAATWEKLDVKPQAAPNDHLLCGGWRCGCYFEQTDKRVTKDVVRKIKAAIRLAK